MCCSCFFFNDTATTEIYTLSLHDALPISCYLLALYLAQVKGTRFGDEISQVMRQLEGIPAQVESVLAQAEHVYELARSHRSEEHTSELQSRQYLVCRLLLEKKKIYDRALY